MFLLQRAWKMVLQTETSSPVLTFYANVLEFCLTNDSIYYLSVYTQRDILYQICVVYTWQSMYHNALYTDCL